MMWLGNIDLRTQDPQEWSSLDIWVQPLSSCFSCFMPRMHNTFTILPSTVGRNAYHTYSLVYVLALQKKQKKETNTGTIY